MPFSFVTIDTESGQTLQLALPLDVPSQNLAPQIMRALGRTIRPGETVELFIETGHGDKRIASNATLGELGIADGQRLRIKRSRGKAETGHPGAHAYLRTRAGEMLPLISAYIIIGRRDPDSQTPVDLDLAPHDPANAVSRRHACISREGENYFLLDFDSTNGTQLNDQDLVPGKKMPLQDGDRIEFGRGLRVTFVKAKAD